FIEVLKEMFNEYNHFAICIACKEDEELDELKRLYESTFTTTLLDYSENISDTSLTDKENNCLEIKDVDEDNENIATLWLSTLNEDEYDDLFDLESTNINKLL
ncbi:3878_t:CDS:2, partial [Cetraspora pellucida]